MTDSKESNEFDYLVKLLMIGDTGVGKSCVVRSFCGAEFAHLQNSTIGIDFEIKFMQVLKKRVKVQLWDTAGQEKFRTITGAYYKGAMGILLCYDITDRISFRQLAHWLKHIRRYSPDEGRGIKIMLIGNKCDHPDRQISAEEGKKFADDYKIGFAETSAKTNTGIAELFETIVSDVVEGFIKDPGTDPRNSKKDAVGLQAVDGRNNRTPCC